MACACDMFVCSGMRTTTLNCLYAKEDLLLRKVAVLHDVSGSVIETLG